MEGLAIVYVTCHKYSYLWDAWLYYYNRNFYPREYGKEYFVSDVGASMFPFFKNIVYIDAGVGEWTKGIRSAIEQIPQERIFFLLDDLFFTKDLNRLFPELYSIFVENDMDSLRISMRRSIATTVDTDIIVDSRPIMRLKRNSKYLVAYSPNIFKKEMLLDFLSVVENPWDSEVKGSKRAQDKEYKIYDYIYPDWYVNTVIKGKLTDRGKELINEAE